MAPSTALIVKRHCAQTMFFAAKRTAFIRSALLYMRGIMRSLLIDKRTCDQCDTRTFYGFDPTGKPYILDYEPVPDGKWSIAAVSDPERIIHIGEWADDKDPTDERFQEHTCLPSEEI